jgi:hypothetical protein
MYMKSIGCEGTKFRDPKCIHIRIYKKQISSHETSIFRGKNSHKHNKSPDILDFYPTLRSTSKKSSHKNILTVIYSNTSKIIVASVLVSYIISRAN